MKKITERLLLFLAFLFAWIFLRYTRYTCRVEYHGPLLSYLNGDKPFLIAWWHQDMVTNFALLVKYLQKRPMAAIVSRSQDGEIASYVIRRHGYLAVRGSSSRGGFEAFRGISSLIQRSGMTGIVVCDGPRPPARVAKFGIAALGRQTGLPIILMRSWGKRQHVFKKSWPRLVIPYPFSPIVVLSAGPIAVPPGATREELEKYRRRVEGELNRLADESERYFV
jgi:lysophospholipid acyltransferase (LPLAT)-like uncharacterized protein